MLISVQEYNSYIQRLQNSNRVKIKTPNGYQRIYLEEGDRLYYIKKNKSKIYIETIRCCITYCDGCDFKFGPGCHPICSSCIVNLFSVSLSGNITIKCPICRKSYSRDKDSPDVKQLLIEHCTSHRMVLRPTCLRPCCENIQYLLEHLPCAGGCYDCGGSRVTLSLLSDESDDGEN